MNAAEVSIVIKARDEASRVLNGVRGAMGNVTGAVGRFGGAMRNSLPIIGAVVGGAAALGFAFANAASDLGEAENKALVTFGDFSDGIAEFAETSARQFGISKRAANEYTATLGNILQASGLAKDESAQMSQQMTVLAADLASFNNIPIDEALEKIRSGLVGEAEPLRTVGVLISEATVKQKAYELGIAATGAELTEAQKVQARYAVILAQTKNAQGDFTRTSTGMANQQRILGAVFEDLRASIGQAFLPVVTQGLMWLTAVLAANQEQIAAVAQVLGEGLAAGIQHVADLIVAAMPTIRMLFDTFVVGLETIAPLVEDFFTFILNNKVAMVVALTAIGAAVVVALGPASLAVGAIVGLVLLIGAIREHWDEIKSAIQNDRWLEDKFGAWGAAFVVIRDVVAAFVTFIRDNWEAISGIVRGEVELIILVVRNALDTVRDIFRIANAVLHGDWSAAWDALKDLVSGRLDFIRDVIENRLQLFRDIFSLGWAAIETLFGDKLRALGDIVAFSLGTIRNFFGDLPGRIVAAIGDLGRLLFDAGKKLIRGFVDGMLSIDIPNPLDMIPGAGAIGDFIGDHLPGGGDGDGDGNRLPSLGDVIGFGRGGVVPGPAGRPRLAVVHGDEEVLTSSQRGARGNIYIRTVTITSDLREALAGLGMSARSL